MLWNELRNRKFHGFKFLRQHPIIISAFNHKKKFIIADFYCDTKKLILEVDGDIHTHLLDYDEARDILVNEMGIKVLRIKNEEVREDLKTVLEKIFQMLQ